MRCAAKRGGLGRRGVVSLEFAVTSAVVILLTLGAAEVGRYFFTMQALRTATAEVVRQVTLQGGANVSAGATPCQGLAGAVQNPAARVPALVAARLTATMSGCASNNGVTKVNVVLNYPYVFTVPILGRTSETLTETATALFN